jgi:hypothetical protein
MRLGGCPRSVFFMRSPSCSGVTRVRTAICLHMSRMSWSNCSQPYARQQLQVETTALARLPPKSVLPGEDEESQKDGLKQDSPREERNGKGSNGRIPRSTDIDGHHAQNHSRCRTSIGPLPTVQVPSR